MLVILPEGTKLINRETKVAARSGQLTPRPLWKLLYTAKKDALWRNPSRIPYCSCHGEYFAWSTGCEPGAAILLH
jgi:hypothetical protein